MIQEAIARLVERQALTAAQAEEAMGEIMGGTVSPALIAGLVVALRTKGETAEEVGGFARAMRARGVRLQSRHAVVADTCGTGGDGKHTLNVSTGAALAVAGAGLPVAKHGNRAMSSRCGSADVFAILGVKIDAEPEVALRCLDTVGLCFCFAPIFHPAMKHAGPVRKELGVRTIFNLLGPLCNPAGAQVQLIGVGSRTLLELEASALAHLGTKRSLIVHSLDGLDELTPTAPAEVIEVVGHTAKRKTRLTAAAAGLKPAKLADLKGGTPEENAAALADVLKGKRGPFRDAIVFNAAALLWMAGSAKTLKDGARLAAASLDSGAASDKLERLKDASQEPLGPSHGAGH